MREEEQLRKNYNKEAELFLETRTTDDPKSPGFINRRIERPGIFEMVPDLSGKKILELGCGPGIHSTEYVKRGAELHGLDLSDEMIRLAKETCPEGTFVQGSAYELPYEDESFDFVISSFLFCHLSEQDKVVKEVKRVLKKGGECIISLTHPMVYMYRNAPSNSMTATNSYFEKGEFSFRIVGNETMFDGFPQTMDEIFKPFLEEGFLLKEFKENRPEKSWLELRPDKDDKDPLFQMPMLVFLRWEK